MEHTDPIESKRNHDRLVHAREDQLKENDRFYVRSAFYWGFIAASFVAYATLSVKFDATYLTTLTACFGMVSSLFWTLVNRGATHWQGLYLERIRLAEMQLDGPAGNPIAKAVYADKGSNWLRAQPFSITKLTIAFSDFTVLIWATLVIRSIVVSSISLSSAAFSDLRVAAICVTLLFSIAYPLVVAKVSLRKATDCASNASD